MEMERGTQIGTNRLFMLIAVALTATLFLGLVGIGGLVVFRYLGGPPEAAIPLPAEVPTETPLSLETATPTPVPSATPAAAPTATRVIVEGSTTAPAGTAGSDPGQDGPGMSSPNMEEPAMPETGLGPLEALGAGLVLLMLLGVIRLARHTRADGRI